MDFIVGLPTSRAFDSILVVVDRLSKLAHFIPTVATVNASALVDVFLDRIWKLHGLPADIVSDRGSVFVSSFWNSFVSILGVRLNTSTAYHPESDGQTERVNQVLEQYLRCYLDYHQTNWVDLLPYAEYAYNSSFHSSTHLTPFEICYGYVPTLDLDVERLTSSVSNVGEEFGRNLIENVQIAQEPLPSPQHRRLD
jgi:hypothetical protein